MERGYLIAALAIITTFTGFSRGFRCVEQCALLHIRHSGALAKAECRAHSAAQAVARLKTHLRPRYAEQAQLLAELNSPAAEAQSAMAEELATQNAGAARCARARAMQEVDRARPDMLRMQQDMGQMRIEPLSLQITLPPDFERQVQQSAEIATRIAAHQVRLQITAAQASAAAKKACVPQQ